MRGNNDRARFSLILFWTPTIALLAQSWVSQQSKTTASLRGVSVVNDKIVWASGSQGSYLRTTDGGVTWEVASVPGAADVDFRGIYAVNEKTAYLLSSGEGDKSRIYKTEDGGAHWTLQFTNPDGQGFFDAIAFWNGEHGLVLGDPVNGQFVILTTGDGGATWRRQKAPRSLAKEGAFAASNSCLIVRGRHDAWFVTGGTGAARVFRSKNGGVSWTATSAPIRSDASSAGIFSIGFADARNGIIVGGDYMKDKDERQNIAVTSDSGKHWIELGGKRPKGFRSAIVFVKDQKIWIATGTSGSDISTDSGKNWRMFDDGPYNALGFASSHAGWAVGPKGRIAKFLQGPLQE